MSSGSGLDFIIKLLRKAAKYAAQDEREAAKAAVKAARKYEKELKKTRKELIKQTSKRTKPFTDKVKRQYDKEKREVEKERRKREGPDFSEPTGRIGFFDPRNAVYNPNFRGELIKRLNVVNELIIKERASGGVTPQTLELKRKLIRSINHIASEVIEGIKRGTVYEGTWRDLVDFRNIEKYGQRYGTIAKTFIKSHGPDWQRGLAESVLQTKKVGKNAKATELDIYEANNYVLYRKLSGVPLKNDYYYKMAYGSRPAFKTTKESLKTIETYIENAPEIFHKYLEPYKQKILKGKILKRWEYEKLIDVGQHRNLQKYLDAKLIEDLNNIPNLNRIIKTEFERLAREGIDYRKNKRMAMYSGGDPAKAIARGVSLYAYESLLTKIQAEPNILIHPSNIESLSKSKQFHSRFIEYFSTIWDYDTAVEYWEEKVVKKKGARRIIDTTKHQELAAKKLAESQLTINDYSTHSKTLTTDINRSLIKTSSKIKSNIDKNVSKAKAKKKALQAKARAKANKLKAKLKPKKRGRPPKKKSGKKKKSVKKKK